MNLAESIFGPEGGGEDMVSPQDSDEDWLAHEDGTCACHEHFWLKNIAMEAATLGAVIDYVGGFLDWLKERQQEGCELEEPVHQGYGCLLRTSVVH